MTIHRALPAASALPLSVDTDPDTGNTYIDIGPIQVSVDADGETLVTCPPALLGLAAQVMELPAVRVAIANASTLPVSQAA